MKKIAIVLALAGLTLGVFAETDYIANKRIDNIRSGTQYKKDRINNLYVHSGADINGGITSDTFNATGAVTLDSTLDVAGRTIISNTFQATGAATLDSTLNVVGATIISNTLTVTDSATLNSNLNVVGATIVSNALTATGDITANADLIVAGFNANVRQTLTAYTNGQIFAITSSYVEVDSVLVAGTTNSFSDLPGTAALYPVVDIINTGTGNITFADSGNLRLNGANTLGQWDSMSLRIVATNVFVRRGGSDN